MHFFPIFYNLDIKEILKTRKKHRNVSLWVLVLKIQVFFIEYININMHGFIIIIFNKLICKYFDNNFHQVRVKRKLSIFKK
jgi:hypothetical protein